MQIQVFKLTLDNHYSEFKEFCIDHWEDHTRTSSRMMNICNLDVNKFFHSAIFCLENNICYWDLYCIQEEIDGTVQWKKNNLLRPDLVHYSGEGYKLQANLFINAFQKSWFGLYKD